MTFIIATILVICWILANVEIKHHVNESINFAATIITFRNRIIYRCVDTWWLNRNGQHVHWLRTNISVIGCRKQHMYII